MSTSSRIISGSAASWIRILINLITQLALVPIYLSYWNVKIYGIWIATQAFINLVSILDLGHQNFLGFEFLKFGKERRTEFALHLWSGVLLGFLIGLFQLILIVTFILSGLLPSLIKDIDTNQSTEVGLVLFIQGVAWLISGSIGGVLVRALYPFGYLPRMGWWGVWASVITALAPVLAVINGAGLLVTGIVFASATVFYNIPLYLDIFKLLKKESIWFSTPSFNIGWKNFLTSLALSGKGLLENVRQQGVRLVLAPLSGASGLVAFTTMRTGANIALQGLGTITSPMMPELMRFLNEKDQKKIEAAFGTVWFVLVAFLAPGVVMLQAFVEPLYTFWTRGHVPFDATLFAVLSLGVLVYALAQPAIAVVTGNNILRPQLLIAALSALVVVSVMFVFVPKIGILGAGIGLLGAEMVDTYLYKLTARKWLVANGLKWPKKSSSIATSSVVVAAIASLSMGLNQDFKWIILVISIILMMANIWRYWISLPELVSVKIKLIVSRVPIVKGLFK